MGHIRLFCVLLVILVNQEGLKTNNQCWRYSSGNNIFKLKIKQHGTFKREIFVEEPLGVVPVLVRLYVGRQCRTYCQG